MTHKTLLFTLENFVFSHFRSLPVFTLYFHCPGFVWALFLSIFLIESRVEWNICEFFSEKIFHIISLFLWLRISSSWWTFEIIKILQTPCRIIADFLYVFKTDVVNIFLLIPLDKVQWNRREIDTRDINIDSSCCKFSAQDDVCEFPWKISVFRLPWNLFAGRKGSHLHIQRFCGFKEIEWKDFPPLMFKKRLNERFLTLKSLCWCRNILKWQKIVSPPQLKATTIKWRTSFITRERCIWVLRARFFDKTYEIASVGWREIDFDFISISSKNRSSAPKPHNKQFSFHFMQTKRSNRISMECVNRVLFFHQIWSANSS